MLFSTQLSHEPRARSSRLRLLLQEVIFHCVVAHGAVNQHLIAIGGRRVEAFPLDDTDIGNTSLFEHRIKSTNSIRFKENAQPIPYAGRNFVEDELHQLLPLSIIQRLIQQIVPPKALC